MNLHHATYDIRFIVCMGHDHSLPEFKSQGQDHGLVLLLCGRSDLDPRSGPVCLVASYHCGRKG